MIEYFRNNPLPCTAVKYQRLKRVLTTVCLNKADEETLALSYIFADHEMYDRLITKYLPKFPHLFQIQESTDQDMNEWN